MAGENDPKNGGQGGEPGAGDGGTGSGGAPGTGEGAGSGGGSPAGEQKVELTQERIQELIDNAYAKGAKNSADAKKVQAMETELEELRGLRSWLEEEAKKKEGGEGDQASADKIAAVKEEYEKRLEKAQKEANEKLEAQEKETQQLREDSLRARVVSGIAKSARDPEEVFTLMKAQGLFQYDSEARRWYVVNEKGKPRLDVDADGDYMDPAKAAVEWLEGRPHHKRPTGRSGAGEARREGQEGAGGESPDFGNLSPSEIYGQRDKILQRLRGGR